jgi:U3 small nucleolar RNA-associated protein 14
MQRDTIFAQNRGSDEVIFAADEQTARHHAQGGLERVHMDVDIEHLYTLAL